MPCVAVSNRELKAVLSISDIKGAVCSVLQGLGIAERRCSTMYHLAVVHIWWPCPQFPCLRLPDLSPEAHSAISMPVNLNATAQSSTTGFHSPLVIVCSSPVDRTASLDLSGIACASIYHRRHTSESGVSSVGVKGKASSSMSTSISRRRPPKPPPTTWQPQRRPPPRQTWAAPWHTAPRTPWRSSRTPCGRPCTPRRCAPRAGRRAWARRAGP